MRLAPHSITRRTIFCESPARGGSMTTTSGLSRPLDQRPHPGPRAARHEAGVLDPIQLRVALGVGDRLGDDLQAPDVAGLLRHRQADRADPAVEVEEALAAAQAGELGRDPIEALGHLGVRLEEGAVGDLQLEPAELLAQAFLTERPGRAVGAAGVALDHRVQVDRGLGKARRRGDEAGLDLAGAPPLADDEVSQHALAGALVVGGNRLPAGPVANLVAGRVAGFRGELAVLDVDDAVPAAAGMEAERRIGAVDLAEGVLELVAVAPLPERRDDRLKLEALEAADPCQGLGDLLLLVGELALVWKSLPGSPRTRLPFVDAAIREAVAGRLQQLDRPRLGEAALLLRDLGQHAIAGQSARDEDDEAVGPRHSPPAEGERVDLQLELVQLQT